MSRQTIFSPCRQYRYALWREWLGGEGYVMFVGLNPSTADETNDDPTIRRCIRFAKEWGFEGLCMANLFAYRATDPKDMMAAADPIGPQNDAWLRQLSDDASCVVAAWGVGGKHLNRGLQVMEMIGAMDCLGHTKDGFPRHPLYIKADIERVDFSVKVPTCR